MNYSEHRPHPALAPFVECVWFARDEAPAPAAVPERVLPDGCVEWIFHFGEPFFRWTGPGRREKQPPSFVVGEMTRPLLVSPGGKVATMGARFRPGAAYRFLPVALDELTDSAAPTSDLWRGEGRDLDDGLREAGSDSEKKGLLERFLLRRLRREPGREPLDEALRLLVKSRGRAAIESLSRRIGWSRRHLEREFLRGVGIPPKALSRVLRFQNALRLAGRSPSPSWSAIAADCGYSDQSHLVREFRALSGATPAGAGAAGDLTRNFVAPARLDELLRPAPGRSARPEVLRRPAPQDDSGEAGGSAAVAFLQDAGAANP